VLDYAGIQSGRLPGLAKSLGGAASEAGGIVRSWLMDALKRALKTTAKEVV
jgi:hypothetical protein